MQSLAPLGLMIVNAALLALPLTPALYELRKRNDAAPLPTSRHDGRIANFAEVFASRLEPFREQLEECRVKNELARAHADNFEILLVGHDRFDFSRAALQGVSTVMCAHSALIPAATVVDSDVFCAQDLVLGSDAAVRAGMAEHDLVLQENSTTLRWAHAKNNILLHPGSAAYGRLSADGSITLEPGCTFQRMSARQIFTSAGPYQDRVDSLSPQTQTDLLQTSTNRAIKSARPGLQVDPFSSSRRRILIHGDFVLAPGESLNANVVATGALRIGRGARFFGSAKSYKDALLEAGASLHGSIVCKGSIHLGPRSFVAGPIMAEQDVVIARDARVGTPDALTTVSSVRVTVAPGCTLHGSVWARRQGIVVSDSDGWAQ